MGKGAVLVPGGAGFVGSYVVERLLKQGRDVVVVDNCSRGAEANLPHGVRDDIPGDAQLLFVRGDVRGMEGGLVELIAEYGVDTIIDFAARVFGVKELYRDIANLLSDNVAMTTALCRAAAGGNVKTYTFISSSCCYDFPGALLPHVEDDQKPCDTSYGASKQFGEQLVRFYAEEYGFEAKAVRLFNVIGRKDNALVGPHVLIDFVTSAWRVKRGETRDFPVVGDGRQTRDFTWVEDAAEAIIAVTDRGPAGAVFNVGTGRETTVMDLAHLVCRTVGVDPATITFTHVPAPRQDIRRRVASIARIETALGWTPKVTLEEGVRDVADWLVAKLEAEAKEAGAA